MVEWKNGLIQTGIDKLMEYLRKEREVGVEEAANSLGVDQETVLVWAKSLQKSGLAEIKYTARRGRILRIIEDVEKSDGVLEDVKGDVSERMKKITQLGRERARLERFEDVMNRIEHRLQKDEDTANELQKQYEEMGQDLDEMEQYLHDLGTVEEDMDELKTHIEDLKRDLDVLETISKHKPDKQGKKDAERKTSLFGKLKGAIPFVSGSKTTGSESRDENADEGPDDEPGDEPEDAPEEMKEPDDTATGETFKCEECERVFDTNRGLKTHVGMVHRRDDENELEQADWDPEREV